MAVILMILASACFVTMSAMVKGLGDEIPLFEIIFIRALLPLPFLVYKLIQKGEKLVVFAWKQMILRSFMGLMAMACFYYAVSNMPLAACIFIGRTQPLLVAGFSPLILNEKNPAYVYGALGIGLLGVALLIKPSLQVNYTAWIAFFGSCFSALAHIMVRKLNRTDTPLSIIFNFFMLTAVVSFSIAYADFTIPTAQQGLLLIGIAFFASTGQYLMTHAYRIEKAPIVAASSYASVLLSIFYGYFIWAEIPDGHVLLGGLFILAGSTFLLLRTRRLPT